MEIISTKVHGILDYLLGFFLMIFPWAVYFEGPGAVAWICVLTGTGILIYSMCTDYEAGVVHVIKMDTHLRVDIFTGTFLAASPWLMGFHSEIYLPHLLAGIVQIIIALLTVKHKD